MKVLVNGGLNLSVLDGWWAEAYTPDVGWAIGDGAEHGDDPAWDRADAEALYAALEDQIVPEFYNRDATRHSRRLGPAYAREHGPADAGVFGQSNRPRNIRRSNISPPRLPMQSRAAKHGAAGAEFLAWRKRIAERWNDLRFGALDVELTKGDLAFVVEVHLAGLNPSDVRVGVVCGTAERRRPISSGNGANAPECARSRSLRVLGTDASYPPGSRFYATDHCCSSDGHGPGRKPNDLAEITPAQTYSRAGDKRMNKPRST